MPDRRRRILGDIALPESLGLEIGPLHAPLVRREEGRVLYVDYASTAELRANFRHPGVDPADIVEVDIIWGERPLREAVGEPADYVVASHVVEHVPDLIGWLLELHAALRVGGIVGLAVPDRRRTFDIRRQVSTPGEMVEAYLRHYRQPSLRQVFDAAALSNDEGSGDWRMGESAGGLPEEVVRRLPLAFDLVRGIAAEPRYVDAHCWIFTPASFVDTAEALFRIGCFPYVLDGLYPTEPGSIEFQVRLRAVTDGADGAIAEGIAAARATLAAVRPASEADELKRRLAELQASAEAARIERQRVEDEAAALQREVEALRSGMAEIRRSTSWRVTAPLRSAGRLFRGRRA